MVFTTSALVMNRKGLSTASSLPRISLYSCLKCSSVMGCVVRDALAWSTSSATGEVQTDDSILVKANAARSNRFGDNRSES